MTNPSPTRDACFDVAALRVHEFPWTQHDRTLYLNHASTGPLPQRTVNMLTKWARLRSEPWRITPREDIFPGLARTRALCANLIGATSAEIALVPNTSFGLSLAARALPLAEGDVVLASDGEFPALVHAWRAVERSRRIRLRLLPTRDGLLDEEALHAALDEPRVRAVTVSWVSFATGYRVDVERLATRCRERGIYLVLDAIQGVGPSSLDVRTCDVDIVCCGGHKWLLSPWGTAFLYVRDTLMSQLEPPVVGWFVSPDSEDYANLLDYDLTHFTNARRFEVMTMPVQDLIAMAESVSLLLELGLPAIERHVRKLIDRIVDGVLDRPDLELITPADASKRSGIVAIAPPSPQAVSARLQARGVRHSLRQGAIRLAPYFYNTEEEMDAALAILCDVA